ncbi:hypothetical protein EJ08DRAFT_693705 [Tothia fuscella]|uniref:Uncharacterized protein n=1 Tax=Tothia fuscella TaxID=1048955 RepID=A0A9P4NXE1_9PEZI|nr:hypothetical protein EJ08DRAFT_693705 [Tothia fuscella]
MVQSASVVQGPGQEYVSLVPTTAQSVPRASTQDHIAVPTISVSPPEVVAPTIAPYIHTTTTNATPATPTPPLAAPIGPTILSGRPLPENPTLLNMLLFTQSHAWKISAADFELLSDEATIWKNAAPSRTKEAKIRDLKEFRKILITLPVTQEYMALGQLQILKRTLYDEIWKARREFMRGYFELVATKLESGSVDRKTEKALKQLCSLHKCLLGVGLNDSFFLKKWLVEVIAMDLNTFCMRRDGFDGGAAGMEGICEGLDELEGFRAGFGRVLGEMV